MTLQLTWDRLPVREKAVAAAAAYLGTLFASVIFMWWLMLVGGNPFKVINIGTADLRGEAQREFHAGDIVVIRRTICADHAVAAQFFPSLQDEYRTNYAIQGLTIEATPGCHPSKFAFMLPPGLPPGEYTYSSLAMFQNNLVGRDEHTVFPTLKLQVLP